MTFLTNPLKRPGRRGTAATEFALVLPLLMTLLLGCVDFGRVGYFSIALANAAGAGGHYAAVHRVTPVTQSHWRDEIRYAVEQDFGAVPDFDPARLTVTADATDEPDGSVLVSVEARYAFQTIVDWPGLPHTIELNESVQFRQYR